MSAQTGLIILGDENATGRLACILAAQARPGDALLLSGPLGAGKSVFSRAFLRAVCRDEALEVPSPTYTLVQAYQAPDYVVSHFDLWRLGSADELEELGWDDAREGVVLVEWPDKLEEFLPDNALHLTLSVQADGTRMVSVQGWEERLSPGWHRAGG